MAQLYDALSDLIYLESHRQKDLEESYAKEAQFLKTKIIDLTNQICDEINNLEQDIIKRDAKNVDKYNNDLVNFLADSLQVKSAYLRYKEISYSLNKNYDDLTYNLHKLSEKMQEYEKTLSAELITFEQAKVKARKFLEQALDDLLEDIKSTKGANDGNTGMYTYL